MFKIRLIDRFFIVIVMLIDMIQGAVLRNYKIFTLLVSHAPQKIGAKACRYRAFKEFLIAFKRVPAYKKFLEKSEWSSDSKKARDIFESLPVMDKPNYILPYCTEDRCLKGKFFDKGVVIDESSGSTGIPYNWVRSHKEREIVKYLIGDYLKYAYEDKQFIVLNTFSMGAWATGFNMAIAAEELGVVKSTGPDVDKILRSLEFFGDTYPYILNGYPPFIKFLFDEGRKRDFPWDKYTIHVLVGGEGMSEGLRDYLLKNAKTVFSGYGASDLEIGVGGENPLSVKIRKLCIEKPKLKKALFGDDQRLPMLFQYNPLDHYIEIINKEIVVTISKPWTLAPKIRYNIKDEGGMITFDNMKDILKEHDIDLLQLEKECNYPRWYLPFLFVFGRKDSTVSVMGANIYPEDIESIVFSDPLLADNINSFSLSLEEDASGNPRPCFEFELLTPEKQTEIEKTLSKIIIPELSKLSGDFKKAVDEYSQAVEPVIRTFNMGEGPFAINETRIKKRYIKKSE